EATDVPAKGVEDAYLARAAVEHQDRAVTEAPGAPHLRKHVRRIALQNPDLEDGLGTQRPRVLGRARPRRRQVADDPDSGAISYDRLRAGLPLHGIAAGTSSDNEQEQRLNCPGRDDMSPP